MLGYEAYLGMPSRYPHWSLRKAYERQKTLYREVNGLPYEMVINSNPCLAYLMKDNSLLLQILTMAHVYGHNDFFKNNRLFKEGTRAEYTLEMFKSHANRIREYIADPSIGYVQVEKVLDAAHAIRWQSSCRIGERERSREEKKERYVQKLIPTESEHPLLEKREKLNIPDLKKYPLEPEEDIIAFLCEYGHLSEWEKDILQIVRDESSYFKPQIETKIMNEGWASYWHYHLLQQLNLPQGFHIEFFGNSIIRSSGLTKAD